MARAFRAWAVNRRRINLVSKLRYGPQTRLVRGIYVFITLEKKTKIYFNSYICQPRPSSSLQNEGNSKENLGKRLAVTAITSR